LGDRDSHNGWTTFKGSRHAEDYVEADLIILLKKMKAIKEKIEADLNAD
jgi:hypothetical protein